MAVNITNCGGVLIKKVDDAGTPLPAQCSRSQGQRTGRRQPRRRGHRHHVPCTTGADGLCTISAVNAGEYWIVETTTPPGHDTAADQHVTIVAGQTNTVPIEFVEPAANAELIKVRDGEARRHPAPGDHPLAGFDIKDSNGVRSTETNASGNACLGDLLFGAYTVSETTSGRLCGRPGHRNR